MKRREFIKIATAASVGLATQGYLPLLAADKRKKAKFGATSYLSGIGDNRFVKPAAISPVTGYLPEFTPLSEGCMSKSFTARYALVRQYGQDKGKANNFFCGSLDLLFSGDTCKTTEVRIKKDGLTNTVKTELQFGGEFNTVSKWRLESSVTGVPDVHFVEKGSWDGKGMSVKSKSLKQEHSTGNLLIGRWSLLPLLSSGKLKSKPLTFDLLDDSTLRPKQTLRYTGEVKIPIAGGTARLDCYAQTGRGIVPTHYLVDGDGRVQLVTMSTVNWALSDLG